MVVSPRELDWRVVIWVTLGTGVEEFSVFASDDMEYFVSLKDAHHVFHSIGMWSCEGAVPG